jgi:hypothetical protein
MMSSVLGHSASNSKDPMVPITGTFNDPSDAVAAGT